MERFTISLDDRLAVEFDALITERGYGNRSEAVRDLLRAELDRTRRQRVPDGACIACLSYVFNHHERDLGERITALQHDFHALTVSTMHAHLDHDHCIETVILRGAADDVRRFADRLCAERGVHHGHVNIVGLDGPEPSGKRSARKVASPHGHRHAPVGTKGANGRGRGHGRSTP